MKRPWLQCNHLLYAIESEDVETAEQLIDGGFDVDDVLLGGKTAISICIQRGKTEIVQLLLRRGCSLSLKAPNGDYPLHLAIRKGDINLVKMLLNNRVDVTAVDSLRRTALHIACKLDLSDIAKVLIEKSTSSTLNAADRDERTALMYACDNGMIDVVEYLLQKQCGVHTTDVCGDTPLLYAINKRSMPEMLKCLLIAGANVNHKNHKGECPLQRTLIQIFAFQESSHKEHFRKMALVLIDHGCNLKIVNELGQAPLHYAVCANDDVLVKKLLNAGCETEVHDKLGWKPIYYACRNTNKTTLELLLKAGADICMNNMQDLSVCILGNPNSGSLLDFILEKKGEMKSLKALCRSVVRKCFSTSIEKNAKFLHIPESLTNYIIHFDR